MRPNYTYALTPPIELAGEALELVGLGAKVPRHNDLAE